MARNSIIPMNSLPSSPRPARVALALAFAAFGALWAFQSTTSSAAPEPGTSTSFRIQAGRPTGHPLGGDPESILERVRLEEELVHSDRTATMLGDLIRIRDEGLPKR